MKNSFAEIFCPVPVAQQIGSARDEKEKGMLLAGRQAAGRQTVARNMKGWWQCEQLKIGTFLCTHPVGHMLSAKCIVELIAVDHCCMVWVPGREWKWASYIAVHYPWPGLACSS